MEEFWMKKIMILFVALTLAVGFISAQEEEDSGIGLTAGLEFGVSGINAEIEELRIPYLTPSIAYENSFGNIDVAAEVEYTFNFAEEVPQSLFAEEEVTYNLSLGDTQGLAFTLHNENDIGTVPEFTDESGDGSILEPSATYTLGLDPGDLYFIAGLPVTYLPDVAIGVYGTAGFAFSFGLGLEATANFAVNPDAGYAGTDFVISYEQESFYGEVEFNISDDFGLVTITPEFDYFFKNFTFYVKAEFADIGADDVYITPALGVKYSF
jgi:hypothetical protein